MTGNTRVPGAEMTGIYAGLSKIAMRKKLGSVPAGAEVSWHNPPVFKDVMKLGRRTEKWDQLDRNLSSFAAMAAAAEIGCSFCLDLNYFMSHNRGLQEDKAREVPRWRESEVFTPLERRVMEYAEAMCQTTPTVTDAVAECSSCAPSGPVSFGRLGRTSPRASGRPRTGWWSSTPSGRFTRRPCATS